MSLRKVATALKTGPASLYAYVDDLQELQALVLDRALGGVDTRGAKRGAWRSNLALGSARRMATISSCWLAPGASMRWAVRSW